MLNILILGVEDEIKIFKLLKHFNMSIDYLDCYEKQDLSKYKMVITSFKYLKSIENVDIDLILSVVEDEICSNRKNLVNIVFNFKQDMIKEFIKTEKWNFYYRSVDKANVKFIYDLFRDCYEYKKIESKDIKFHKI